MLYKKNPAAMFRGGILFAAQLAADEIK